MSAQPERRVPAHGPLAEAPPAAPTTRRDKLAEVAERVRVDARHQPDRTLKDGEVPAGGE